MQRGKNSGERGCQKKETSFFISNLPERSTKSVLWEVFRHRGAMSDAYVAKKKDLGGNGFGFIRFKGVNNASLFAEDLSGTKIGEAVVNVSVAKYAKGEVTTDYIKKPTPPSTVNHTKGDGTRVEFQSAFKQPGVSYKAVVEKGQGRATSAPKKELNLEPAGLCYPSLIVGRAVVGVAKGIKELNESKVWLKEAGFPNVAVSYIGGLKVMLVFNNPDQAMDFMKNHGQSGEKFLNDVSIWDGQEVPFDRVAGLKVVGLPIMLRDSTNYDKIGEIFGEKICSSNFSWKDMDNSTGDCFVLTKVVGRIQEEIIVKWKGKSYPVWVSEEMKTWAPSFCEDSSMSDKSDGESVCDSDDEEMEEGEFCPVSPAVQGRGREPELGVGPEVTFGPLEGTVRPDLGTESTPMHRSAHACMESNVSLNVGGDHLHVINKEKNDGGEMNGIKVGLAHTPASRKRPRMFRSPSTDSPKDLSNELEKVASEPTGVLFPNLESGNTTYDTTLFSSSM